MSLVSLYNKGRPLQGCKTNPGTGSQLSIDLAEKYWGLTDKKITNLNLRLFSYTENKRKEQKTRITTYCYNELFANS